MCFSGNCRNDFTLLKKEHVQPMTLSQKRKAFDNIRISGNIAAHNLYADKKYKIENVNSFIDVLEFFNNYRKNNKHIKKADFAYPLCQLSIEQFLLIPDEDAIKRKIEIDSKTVK